MPEGESSIGHVLCQCCYGIVCLTTINERVIARVLNYCTPTAVAGFRENSDPASKFLQCCDQT